MKKQSVLLAVLATLACGSISQASITNAWWHDDGDGAVVCSSWIWDGTSTLTMAGTQYGGTGHRLGWAKTDTTEDPTLFLGSGVDNDTGYAWNGYQVNVIMAVPFTFVNLPPGVQNPPNNDWASSLVVQPTLQVVGPYTGKYEGTLDYSGPSLVGIGDELDFNYAIHFGSSLDYSFTQEMIPQLVNVPEPGTVALLAMGGLGLALRLRRSSRKGA